MSQVKKVSCLINITTIKIDGKSCTGMRADLPDSPPLLLIIGEKGFIMCGFLNMESAEKLGVTAAVVSGVKTFEDVLNGQVKATTSKAKALGVEVGMKGTDALKRLS
jgi:uncharacterized protein YunC (DUF1805 family)